MTTEPVLDIRGHTVRRDGEIVATLTYSNGYTNVRTPEGTVIGRTVLVGKNPERFHTWDAKHPAAWTPSDDQLAQGVPLDTAIAVILWRHEQEQRRQTTIETRDSRDYPGSTTLVAGRGNGETHIEVTLADLRALVATAQARIDELTAVR